MNKDYIEFDEAGRIICTMSVSHEVYMANAFIKPRLLEGSGDPALQYVKDDKIVLRPTQQTTLEGQTLKNLPVPCQIKINNETYDCNDDIAELEFDMPITHRITVSSWPYLDAEFTYEN